MRPADDLVVLFTSGSRGAPKGVDPHPRRRRCGPRAAGLDARCVGADERLYIPMPFFWTGGFGGGLLTVLVAGATLLTEAVPEAGADARASSNASGPRCSAAGPTRPPGSPPHPAFADRRPVDASAPGSLGAVLPPDRAARARRPGQPVRHDRDRSARTAARRLDIDLPPGKHGSCGRPFDGVEVRIVDPETGAPRPPGEPGRDPACADRT